MASKAKIETVEQYARRLGVFSPGEIDALVKAGIGREKIDQLAKAKGYQEETGKEDDQNPRE